MRQYRAILMALMSLGVAMLKEYRSCGMSKVPVASRQNLNRVFWSRYDQTMRGSK